MHPKLDQLADRANAFIGRRQIVEIMTGMALVAGIESLALKVEAESKPPAIIASAVEVCAVESCAEPAPTTTTTLMTAEATTSTEAPTTTTPVTSTTTTLPPAETPFHATSLQTDPRGRGAVGADQSWPNCNTPLRPGILFGIIGVTDGESFETNRCLVQLADKFRAMNIEPGLYVNVDLEWENALAENSELIPCPADFAAEVCPAYRWGYRGGLYAVQSAWDLGVSSQEWYLDVEHNNDWTSNTDLNRLAILGTMDAIRNEAGRLLGIAPGEIYEAIYTYPSAWQKITGGLKLPVHTWLAKGGPESELVKYCDDPGYNVTGGGVIMVQTVDDLNPGGKLDINVHC